MGPLQYFSYLVKQKEIDDTSVLNYYGEGILNDLYEIKNSYGDLKEKVELDSTLSTALDIDMPPYSRDLEELIKVWQRKLLSPTFASKGL